ncbi:FtsX-like permease family protein [Streptomyces sp. NBC_00683]|uniref:ABC transporter permease n=1 Tax=Streptomyces sp. NBC_00683 TaxID=2903670 RepID=UPI002E2F90CB|nr:FtsX-like permease family protein [Streptomyces sp. NBC_00683]
MSALGKVVRSGVGRRRVQTLVIGLATMMAVAASILGGSLLAVSGAPFDDAFAQQHGAHLSVRFDAGKVGDGQLSKSGDAEGVSGAAGPFRTATVTPRAGRSGPGWPMTVVGRGDPGRDVDEVTLLDGRWPTRPGEIVLSAGAALIPTMGMKVAFPALPGKPSLTVVGLARSITQTADAWVVPAQMPALTSPGSGGYQMLYRFTEADTAAQITAGGRAVAETLPPGAAVGEQSWLTVRESAERDTALYVPFLIAFGALGLVMSVLTVGNVVASAVGTGTRRIGILKAVGFTPAQVVRAYVAQALIPAAAGTALGVLAGHLLAVPVLAETGEVYGAASPLAVAPWVDLTVIAGVLGLVAATAWASAWRAGRLRTVDALAVGHAASTERGRWAARLAGRLPLPQPVALGLARPFARPARALNKDLAPLGVSARVGGLGAGSDMVVTLNALSAILTLMLVTVAALGVLNGVLLDTRERVREIGVHKALGMTPRQTIAMVLTSVALTGLVAGALGVPLGVTLHGWVLPAMGDSAGLRLPDSVIAVYHGAELLPLALGGLLIATLGALLPAGWAAKSRTATALRTE